MPELPEVETVRRVLKKNLINQTIKNVESNYPKMILEPFEEFKNHLVGAKFKDVLRKGKFLIFELSNGYYLVSHLRMEGKYFLEPKDSMSNKHIHVIMELDDYTLYYQDTRKFGIMFTRTKDTLYTTEPLLSVANDPIEGVDITKMYDSLLRKKKTIKEALLDQSIMSGLGNIYVDEVLYMAHVSPLRKACKINLDELNLIVESSKNIFLKSITLGGTTIKSFTSSKGHAGSYQEHLLVHTKETCPKCGKRLTIIKIGGRSSYYCDNCQK